MNFKGSTLFILALLMGLSAALPARAEKMDISTHSMVIEQLELALSDMDKDDSSRSAVLLRLGDLYSERARLDALQTSESAKTGGKEEVNAEKDRRKAMADYEQGLVGADSEFVGKVQIQLAHLHELVGEKNSAEEIYKKIIKGGKSHFTTAILGEAYAGLGEIEFSQAKFAQALQDFKAALPYTAPMRKGYVTYRMAWCELNLGHLDIAIADLVKILKTRELLMHESTQGPVVDVSFQDDVSRDLATFYARGEVTEKTIQTLIELSPDKKEIMIYFAKELERLGNKKSAMMVWGLYVEDQKGTTQEQIAAHIRRAQLEFDIDHKDKAITELEQAVAIWKKSGCKDAAVCEGLRLQFKKFVSDWAHFQKKNPSANLLQAYTLYVSVFHDDAEMHFWAAQMARDLKKYQDALNEYHECAILSITSKDPKAAQYLEPSLMGEVEMSELLKDPSIRITAYNDYLKLNPKGSHSLDVRYQLAHAYYEKAQYQEAGQAFHDVALRPGAKADEDLQIKAADLALDSSVFLKNDAQVESWSAEFAQKFPKRSSEYTRISRKAALNQVASSSNNGKSSADMQAALIKLDHVNLAGASDQEKVTYYKNKIQLAEKVQNISTVETAGIQMAQLKSLSRENKEYALEAQLWAAEMSYDFAKALKVSLKMSSPKLSNDERLLRLAMLAELANQNPRKYQDQYLKTTHNSQKAALMRAKIVRSSTTPARELQKQLPYLKAQPDLVADLALDTFARTHDYAFAEKILKIGKVRNQPAGRMLSRIIFLKDFDQLAMRLTRQQLITKGNAQMQRSLSERISLLKKNEIFAQKAIATHDWSLQILTLSLLADQNERLYNDILNLPAPKGLKAKQKAQYSQLVAQRAEPFQAQSLKIRSKVSLLWNQTQNLEQLLGDYNETRGSVKTVVSYQLNALSHVAPSSVQSKLNQALNVSGDQPSREDVQAAFNKARQQPFNVSSMQKLKEIEEKRGVDTMVTYLDARMNRLQTTRTQQ